MESKIIQSDVLIVGSGGAGARAAIEVSNAGFKPIIVSKGLSFRSGCTGMAEGGYNAVFGFVDADDTKETHFNDTLKGGNYLNDSKLVNILVNESPDRLIDLENYGALFDRQENGKLNQRPFGGQSFRRTCFAGDRTGHELITALKEEIIKRDIETIDEVMITKLILNDSEFPKVIGAVGLDLKDSTTIFFNAKSVILATGGAGQLYPVTSNTFQKNGDGYALSWDAGADLIDMEQVQFHPTGMIKPKAKAGVLVTEAVRGEGGKLINSKNERFMFNYDEKGELATRDVVARSIYNEIRQGRGTDDGGVYLDISHLNDDVIDEKLETMVEQFADVGVNIKNEAMEVAPTAHHCMGGLFIDEDGKSSIDGLYGCGEVTGGVHGANRLGGNALADTQVFGKRAGKAASVNCEFEEFESNNKMVEEEEKRIKSLIKDGKYKADDIKEKIKKIMWENVSIIRNEEDLRFALKELNNIKDNELKNIDVKNTADYNKDLQDALEVINMVEVGILIVKSAIIRRESRGAHFREDFPDTKEGWAKSILMGKTKLRFIKR
ncbi:fumarate reductase (CoM/CoB) subunit TfrA [uncultured Methanobrevibacter sp.]|uniref:fumarate reductase (CoM/CoB) subunit TfrA n=1 Tax=uncultured Methanobrevibacter sp. TaxID=253161 RepID=UPI0025D9C862|nr:fumarate reductase (CoM/CoB) subunit TfrA [uncultured Methanobrevibacter sp.]